MATSLPVLVPLCFALCFCGSRGHRQTAPRVHLSFKELMETRTARPFSFSFNTSDYRILLMDQDQDRIYVGTREYVLALDLHNINKEPLIIHWPATHHRRNECRMAGKGHHGECANYVRLIEPWNRTHLYTCGTGAYNPMCAFINRGWRSEEYLFRLVPGNLESGKGKCPYDPKQDNMAALIDGNLYAGVHVDFMGMDAALFRTLGSRPAVRTEQYDSRWLNARPRRSRRQDIKHGDPLRQCRGFNAKVEKRLMETAQYGVEGSSTFLECQPRSPQATVKWLIQRDGSNRRKILKRDEVTVKTEHGILLKSVQKSDSGTYHCVATENNFKHTVARVNLRVLDREAVDAVSTGPAHSQSPKQAHGRLAPSSPQKELLHLVGQPEISVINQYCESYWRQLSRVQRPKRTSEHATKTLGHPGRDWD
nr:PREDICTED: semaphorin-3F-like [Latimeria chalumnae]|eukprot:XP_014347170.1 PREDICTED: semaphorin-3F-like [Latimeria chalumnae]